MVNPKQFLEATSRYREAAIKLLGAGNPGDVLTVAELRTAMDAAALPHADVVRHIRSARRHLEKKSLRWWKWSRDFKTLVCIDEKTAVAAMSAESRAIKRKATRTLYRASCVDPTTLTVDDRRQFDLQVAQAALAQMAVSKKMGNALEKRGTLEPPKLEQVAELFGKK